MGDIETRFDKFKEKTQAIRPGNEFMKDFALWETRLRDEGDDIEAIKQDIRDSWADPEGRAYWEWRVKQEAVFLRDLQRMAAEVLARMKKPHHGPENGQEPDSFKEAA